MPPIPDHPHADADPVAPRRVLAWVELLRGALVARDELLVLELFGRREARLAPRDVLEEALALARAPAGSLRAPLALLRFAWMVQRLDAAGEPLPGTARPAAGYGDAGADAAAPAAQLELAWPRRHLA